MAESATLRDARRTYHFWVDDAVIDTYGSTLGPFGLAVYLALARRSKGGTSFPSLKRLAADTGMSKRSVVRAIAALEECGLITKESRTTEDGDATSNLYTLLDLSHKTIPPSATQALPSATQAPPSVAQTLGVVPDSHYPSVCVAHEGVSLQESHEEAHTPLAEPLAPLGVPEEPPVCAATQTESRKYSFPSEPDKQAQLRTMLLTPALSLWVETQGIQLDLEREYTRWLNNGLAHGRQYADLSAAFRNWLTSPYQEPLPKTGLSRLETRQHDADAAARRFVEEDTDGACGQTSFSVGAKNRVGSVLRPLGQPTPTGLLAGAVPTLHSGGI